MNTPAVKLILAKRSGNKCALPECNQPLSSERGDGSSYNTGEAAHIAGKNPTGPRYDPAMTDAERGGFDNLIFLCPNCHKKVDEDSATYTVACLTKIKAEHEQRVHEAVSAEFANVSFQELDTVVKGFVDYDPGPADASFTLVAPDQKLKRNDLGRHARDTVKMSLALSPQVREHITKAEREDPDLSQRLKTGFLAEYQRLKVKGYTGEILFELMCDFAQQGFRDRPARNAALALLIYLFEACEVFER